jgi:hypothetical protein
MGARLWTTLNSTGCDEALRFHQDLPDHVDERHDGTSFLSTTDRKADGCDTARDTDLNFNDPALDARLKAIRQVQWAQSNDPKQIAGLVKCKHQIGTLSLVVCNTVETAREFFLALPETPPKILLTSRFRRQDRDANETRLLEFEEKRRRHPGPIPDDPGPSASARRSWRLDSISPRTICGPNWRPGRRSFSGWAA